MAWRSVASADGSLWMLHQRSMLSEIDLTPPDATHDPSASSYGGGGFSCNRIVTPAVSRIKHGSVTSSVDLMQAVLAVDIAASPDQQFLAIAAPGARDPLAPQRSVIHHAAGRGSNPPPFAGSPAFDERGDSVFILLTTEATGQLGDCTFPQALPVTGQATAVAFTPDQNNGPTRLLVQSREPAALTIVPNASEFWRGATRVLSLGGSSVADTGHDLFHRDAGSGVACASCHGEGGDDGHTWLFSGMGPRRSQSLFIGLEDTAPFHWDASLASVSDLMTEVFVGRMGGVHQSKPRLDALSRWLFELTPPAPAVSPESPEAMRGEALFHASEVGCAECHSGNKWTNNKSYDVGTGPKGELFQVPALVGVGYRAPFMHTGCAPTLADRFDPACGGGDKHGKTSHLDASEIADLVAYLRSL